MSETGTTTTTESGAGQNGGAGTNGGQGTGEKTFSQAEVDRIVAERLKRENIQELRAKATKLDTLEADRKTEDEKVAERLAKLEAANKQLEVGNLRMRIANQHKISVEDAELFLTADNEDDLVKQAKRLAEKAEDAEQAKRRKSGHVPNEGTNDTPAVSAERQFARQLFQGDQ